MVKYFLSETGSVWGWNNGITVILVREFPGCVNHVGIFQLDRLMSDSYLKEITEAEAKEIAGELPWK